MLYRMTQWDAAMLIKLCEQQPKTKERDRVIKKLQTPVRVKP